MLKRWKIEGTEITLSSHAQLAQANCEFPNPEEMNNVTSSSTKHDEFTQKCYLS